MVVRIYRAVPKPEKLKDYEHFLIDQAIPLVKSQKGCLGAQAMKSLGVVRELLFISFWDSLESVKAFAGGDWNQAKMVGFEADWVEETDVKHYHQIAGF